MKLREVASMVLRHLSYSLPPNLFSALFHYAEDTDLGVRLIRIAESLIKGHPNENNLSAKLTLFICSVVTQVEPFQALPERIIKGCNSALIAGQNDMAMNLSMNRTIVSIYAIPNLLSVQKDIVHFFRRGVSFMSVSLRQTQLTCLTTPTSISSDQV